jgi:type III pantothenate kinase
MTEKQIILTADIGNSSIDAGFFDGEKLLDRLKLPAKVEEADQWKQQMPDIVFQPKAAIICSVNPEVEKRFTDLIAIMFDVEIHHVRSDACTRLKNLCREPAKVGADRISNAYGAWKFYGLPAVVVDVGTAITIDAVSASAEFLGGAIAPGPRMSAASLASQTAQLPQIKPQLSHDVIGTDTESAIQSGIMHGTVGMILHIVSEMKRQLLSNGDVRVIITGGGAQAFKPALEGTGFCFDPDLTLKGLCAIYKTEILEND